MLSLENIAIIVVAVICITCCNPTEAATLHREKRNIQPLSSVGTSSSAGQDNKKSSNLPVGDITYSNDGKTILVDGSHRKIMGPVNIDLDNVVEYDNDNEKHHEVTGSTPSSGDNGPVTPKVQNTDILIPVGEHETNLGPSPNHSPTMPQPINFIITFFINHIHTVASSTLNLSSTKAYYSDLEVFLKNTILQLIYEPSQL